LNICEISAHWRIRFETDTKCGIAFSNIGSIK
jgi:hypothetical protein